MIKTRKWISIAFMVIGSFFMLSASSANAAQRFIPWGIDASNATKAKVQVLNLAEVNDDYALELARQTGAPSFNRSDYKSDGYGKAPSNTNNSADIGGGSVGASSGGVGVKTLILVNTKTKVKVHIMVRCANLRLKKTPVKPKLLRISKGKTIHFKKRFSQTVATKCPSGQAVTVLVNGVASGYTKARTTVKALGEAQVEIALQMKAKIQLDVNVKCDAPPTTPLQNPVLVCGPNEHVINGACQANSASSEQEVDVDQTCKGQIINNSCTSVVIQITQIIQINANCSLFVYGDGHQVYVENGSEVNICSTKVEENPPTTPQVSAECTGLTATGSGLTVNARAYVTTEGNVTFLGVTFVWGDGTETAAAGLTASHTYTAGGTFTIRALARFSTPSGEVTRVCQTPFTITVKNGTAGAGSGNSGTPINNGGGAPDSGTAPSADCYARDGNDELVPGRIDPVTKQCVRV